MVKKFTGGKPRRFFNIKNTLIMIFDIFGKVKITPKDSLVLWVFKTLKNIQEENSHFF